MIVLSGTFLIALVNLSSCTKSNTKTVTDYDTVVVKDTITVTAAPSTMSLLTGKLWEIDSVYTGYTGPGTGTLIYARGSSGNLENLDGYYGTYTSNGVYWATENSAYLQWQYSFVNSDSTVIKNVSTTYGTDYGRILKLTSNSFTIYDSTNSALDIEILAP